MEGGSVGVARPSASLARDGSSRNWEGEPARPGDYRQDTEGEEPR